MTELEYLELLDWTARQTGPDTRARASALKTSRPGDIELVSDFGKLFCTVAGRCSRVDTMRSHRTHRRLYLRRRARELMTTG